MCKIGDVVVVGGVRRSALISLSDLSDYDMSKAKSGAWWETVGHRRLANNSAVYYKKPSIGEFLTEWGSLYESKSGERGIVNMDGMRKFTNAPRRDLSQIQGLNPCGEILLRSKQLCNLTEVIVESTDTPNDLVKKIEIATTLGTVQSSLTNFKYLRKIWKDNCEEERLLGVSLTGQLGHQTLSGQAGIDSLISLLTQMREVAIDQNYTVATAMGINPSTAITTAKPSGTVSQLTASSSGMHPWHSEYYLRSVRGDNKDPITEFLKDAGIPHEPDVTAQDSTTVFYFPQKAPKGALTRTDLTAIEHLEIWKAYKENWTEHNPSVTISVREDEWIGVANWVYENWDCVGGISFLPYSDHTYRQAPYQDCDEATYKQFVADMPKSIDWSLLSAYEHEDTTTGTQTLSCTAGNCEVVDLRS
jgi:ribonucleoside-diphosphate reductase alpha chain